MPDFLLSLFVRFFNAGIVSLISLFLIARHFGHGGKGEITEALFPATLIIIFIKCGIDYAALMILRKHEQHKDSLLGAILLATVLSSVLVWALLSPAAQPIWESLLSGNVRHAYLMISLWLIPTQIFHDTSLNVTLGSHNFRTYTYMKLVQPILFVLCMLLLWCLEKFNVAWAIDFLGQGDASEIFSVFNVLCLYVLSNALAGALLFAFSLRRLKFSFVGSGSCLWDMVRAGMAFQLIAILLFCNRRIDVLVIIRHLDPGDNGIYAAAVGLIEFAWFVSRPLSTMVLERTASGVDDGSSGRILRFTMFCSTVLIAVLTCAAPFLFAIMSGRFYLAYTPFLMLIPGVLLFNIHQVLSQVFYGLGEGRKLIPIMVTGLIINVVLNHLWVDTYELTGVACASTLSYSFIGVSVLIMVSRKLAVSPLSLILPKASDFPQLLAKFKAFRARHQL